MTFSKYKYDKLFIIRLFTDCSVGHVEETICNVNTRWTEHECRIDKISESPERL